MVTDVDGDPPVKSPLGLWMHFRLLPHCWVRMFYDHTAGVQSRAFILKREIECLLNDKRDRMFIK